MQGLKGYDIISYIKTERSKCVFSEKKEKADNRNSEENTYVFAREIFDCSANRIRKKYTHKKTGNSNSRKNQKSKSLKQKNRHKTNTDDFKSSGEPEFVL